MNISLFLIIIFIIHSCTCEECDKFKGNYAIPQCQRQYKVITGCGDQFMDGLKFLLEYARNHSFEEVRIRGKPFHREMNTNCIKEWRSYSNCCKAQGFGPTGAYEAYNNNYGKQYQFLNEKIHKLMGKGWVEIFKY